EKVLAPDTVQVPVPALTRPVVEPVLLTMAPANSPVPAVDPCRVRFLAPTTVAVRLVVNFSRPVPDWSIVPPPVVPFRLIVRSVVSPAPRYVSVPVVVVPPRSIRPLATVVGRPKPLLARGAAMLLREETRRLPCWVP